MSFDPLERVRLGHAHVEITRLGFGTAEIGGLYTAVSDDEAATVLDHAWDSGVRYFDTAPQYGLGNSERRLGAALRGRSRDAFTLSSKVGRLLVPAASVASDADMDLGTVDSRGVGIFKGVDDVRIVYDYSRDGVMRSIEATLQRMGLDRLDIVYIHDPDEHWQDAMESAYPALHELREQGVVGAIGAGMTQVETLSRFAREGDFDVFMVAGRYTLLDQTALPELLPICVQKGISVVAVGVMNSGILADPRVGARFNYVEAPPDLIERAQRLAEVCSRHGVALKTAAIQFPMGHPSVASVTSGVRTAEHFDDYPRAMVAKIPADLWQDLRHQGLIDADAPVPGDD